MVVTRIGGLVVEHIVAIDVTRARFPAEAFALLTHTESQAKIPSQYVCCLCALSFSGSQNHRLEAPETQLFTLETHVSNGLVGITSASHAEGPGLNPQGVHLA